MDGRKAARVKEKNKEKFVFDPKSDPKVTLIKRIGDYGLEILKPIMRRPFGGTSC